MGLLKRAIMDDILFPDEGEPIEEEEVHFQRASMASAPSSEGHDSGVNPSKYVTITFDRFVTLVANHSFMDVVEDNKDEEVIITTNLLTDLANARRFMPSARSPLMIAAGLVIGVLLGYLIFGG